MAHALILEQQKNAKPIDLVLTLGDIFNLLLEKLVIIWTCYRLKLPREEEKNAVKCMFVKFIKIIT